MNEVTKINRALNSMPWEVIVQYSSSTDSIDVLYQNAIKESQEENTSVLHILLTYAKEVLETYENELMGHVNYEMQEDDRETWIKERKEIKAYIKKIEKYVSI